MSTLFPSLVSAAALAAAAPAFSQTDEAAPSAAPQEQVFRVPTYVKAPLGPKAVLRNAEGEQLGVVHDHVIDLKSGKVMQIAVGIGASDEVTARTVPFARFVWNPEDQRLVLPMSADELAEMPEYAPETAKASGNASDERGPRTLAASTVVGSSLLAVREPVASIGELVLEPQDGTIAFVLASSEGSTDPMVIPWKAMTWHAPKGEGEELGRFAVALQGDALASAPRLKDGDTTQLVDREMLEGIYGFYRVDAPHAARGKGQTRN